MNPIFERHLETLKTKLQREVVTTPLSSGAILITIKDISLPTGWNSHQTDIKFVAPAGYPFAPPDCFWTYPVLMLKNGLAAQASNNQTPAPEGGTGGTWFSWHVQHWDPNKDNLLTFFRLIERRLANPQ